MDKKNITGIILAGGKSARMGADKGFLLLNRKPFIQYSIDALKPLVAETLIVSDNPDYDTFGLRRVTDRLKDAGPIAGIYSGLEASSSTYNIVLSCDIPLITSPILEKLIANAEATTSDIVQIESRHKTMPLIALYKKQCKDVFYKVLQTGERRLRIAVNRCTTKNVVLGSDHAMFTININTQKELKIVENVYHH